MQKAVLKIGSLFCFRRPAQLYMDGFHFTSLYQINAETLLACMYI